ncbi:MAG: hypothetical protein IPM48_09195 [Saprospiraceae bacterium]|nr:hypothetical protein [Saprospiraceae bacterium]MBK9632904.1 hypothetical protein [Saprospiraceae bacterium]
MIDKHEVLDLFIKSICRLQGWKESDINSHMEEIGAIALSKIHSMRLLIGKEYPTKKFLIATKLVESLEETDVLIETLINTSLLLAADTWEEYEALLKKAENNLSIQMDASDIGGIDFETLINHILNKKIG